MRKLIFSAGTESYIPFIRVLARSFLNYHPDFDYYYFCLDPVSSKKYPNECFKILPVTDLNIPEIYSFLMRYEIVEAATGVKPYCFDYLFNTIGADRVLFFDADIKVFARLTECLEMLEKHEVVLTPHITDPLPEDGLGMSNQVISIAGMYNMGFGAMAKGQSSQKVINFWKSMLYKYCYQDPKNGLVVDQKWMEFCPSLIGEKCGILRDQRYNVAYWNLHERGLKDVIFYHFSGINLLDLFPVSKYQNRWTLGNLPLEFTRLFENYRHEIFEAGYHDFMRLKYAWNYFYNGDPVTPAIRRAYRRIWEAEGEKFGNPFKTNIL